MNGERFPRRVDPAVEDRRDESEIMLERLIRMADAGPAPPSGGVEQVRRVIRPLWRAEVRRLARRRRLLWAGGGLAAAASLVLAMIAFLALRPAPSPPPSPIGTLAKVVGTAELLPPCGEPVDLKAGSEGFAVEPGSWLRTGDESRAALLLDGGQSLRIDSASRVRLSSARSVDLDRGAVYLESEGVQTAGLEVRTGMGVARDIGTQFEVRLEDGSLSVRVREGSVSLDTHGEELVIQNGHQVSVAKDGAYRTAAVASYDPCWAWVQEVAPPFEIEGRTVVAFLDWVSSETGLWVDFADPEVERFAATTLLHGTIGGLKPTQAPEVVLPGCGLVLRRGIGRITIDWPPGSAAAIPLAGDRRTPTTENR